MAIDPTSQDPNSDALAASEKVLAQLDAVVQENEQQEELRSALFYKQQFDAIDSELAAAIDAKNEGLIRDLCEKASRLFPLIPQWRAAELAEFKIVEDANIHQRASVVAGSPMEDEYKKEFAQQEQEHRERLRVIDAMLTHYNADEIIEGLTPDSAQAPPLEQESIEVLIENLRKLKSLYVAKISEIEKSMSDASELQRKQRIAELKASIDALTTTT